MIISDFNRLSRVMISDALRNLVPFVQFKKREKQPWRGVTLQAKSKSYKSPTLLKATLLHGCFLRFLNCTNGFKSCKTSHILNGLNHHSIIISYIRNLNPLVLKNIIS